MKKIFITITYMKELEGIIDDVSYGVRLRSRYQWYEGGEKSSKFFHNLEKKRGSHGQIKKVIVE